MVELLVLGGVVFWLLLAVWIVALFVSVEYFERGWAAFACTVAYLAALYFGFHVDVLHILVHHPILILVGMALYFPIGGAWAFFRWYMFVHAQLDKYIEFKTQWLISKGQTSFDDIPDSLKEEWAKYLDGVDKNSYIADLRRKDIVKPPLVREHKSKLLRWIGYWPISVISWAFNDMVRGFCKMIYSSIANWLQDMSNKIFEKVKKDLPDDFKQC